MVDRLDLVAMALRPARVHAEQHLGPVLALGPAGAGIDLDIGIVRVRLAREQRRDLVPLRPFGKLGEAAHGIVGKRGVAFGLGHLEELGRVGKLPLDRPGRADRLLQPPPLAHDVLGVLGVVPQRRVFDLGVELLEPLHRRIPIEEPAEQRQGGIDLVDMGLRFGAHFSRNSGFAAAVGGLS